MTSNKIEQQFLKIFEKNKGIIIRISGAYAKTTHDREDLINDIALELFRSFKRFQGNSKVSTWIYRVALNTSMNYKRKRKNETLFSTQDFRNSTNEVKWIELDDSPNLDILYQCIDDLNEINKAIILLYLDNNSHDEISEIMGMSKTNIGTRVGRIKGELKKLANKKK